jgi:hypothetical protein
VFNMMLRIFLFIYGNILITTHVFSPK